jgi:hypothetical protein
LAPAVWALGAFLNARGLRYPYAFACLILASPAALSVLIATFAGARRRADQRDRLTARLHTKLAARGLSSDSTAPAALELRAAIWLEAQRDLSGPLAALREQLGGPRSLAESVERVYDARALQICGVSCLISTCVALIFGLIGKMFVFCVLLFVLVLIVLFVFFVIIVAVPGRVDRAIAYHEFTREQRHIVALSSLIDSKGGLSLVDDDLRSMLQGALSDAPNPSGQIELVAHPPGEGGS